MHEVYMYRSSVVHSAHVPSADKAPNNTRFNSQALLDDARMRSHVRTLSTLHGPTGDDRNSDKH